MSQLVLLVLFVGCLVMKRWVVRSYNPRVPLILVVLAVVVSRFMSCHTHIPHKSIIITHTSSSSHHVWFHITFIHSLM
ncbi:hypothetical protein Y032_0065g3641 [Ancylostoma ceylanicum]|uniref:Uncharacterized protein n=1 Tax=Ancylostoma ceylanicum TaxID=53326 RepID=A0A016U187_9BILA|nr:hypothetical protein Y032_0065g3641 [Ancylostoma ceylanicum]